MSCFLGDERTFLASVGPTERGGSLRRPSDVAAVVLGSPGLEEEAAAAVKGGCALASETGVLVTASVGEGVRVARASAAAMPKGGAGAGAVSSTALNAGGLAVGLVVGMTREGQGWLTFCVPRLAARSENCCISQRFASYLIQTIKITI